jgi:hypothetical protein
MVAALGNGNETVRVFNADHLAASFWVVPVPVPVPVHEERREIAHGHAYVSEGRSAE